MTAPVAWNADTGDTAPFGYPRRHVYWLSGRRTLLALYLFWGRMAHSDTVRQLSWIAGASQALAVIVVIFAFILSWLALLLAGIFAAIALLFLFSDRG